MPNFFKLKVIKLLQLFPSLFSSHNYSSACCGGSARCLTGERRAAYARRIPLARPTNHHRTGLFQVFTWVL